MAGALVAGKIWEILAATLDPPAFGPVNVLSLCCRLAQSSRELSRLRSKYPGISNGAEGFQKSRVFLYLRQQLSPLGGI